VVVGSAARGRRQHARGRRAGAIAASDRLLANTNHGSRHTARDARRPGERERVPVPRRSVPTTPRGRRHSPRTNSRVCVPYCSCPRSVTVATITSQCVLLRTRDQNEVKLLRLIQRKISDRYPCQLTAVARAWCAFPPQSRRRPLGTTLGPHVVPAAERRARLCTLCTAISQLKFDRVDLRKRLAATSWGSSEVPHLRPGLGQEARGPGSTGYSPLS